MKKLSKNMLSLFLCLLVVSLQIFTTTAIATENGNDFDRQYHKIIVPGIMSSDLYINTDSPEDGLAWPPSTDAILDLVKNCVPALLEFSVTRDWDKLGHTISPLAYDLFNAAICDEDGNITNGSGIIFEFPDENTILNKTETIFRYDWRADPLVSANQLNDYINYVLDATKQDKVVIECHSLGGIISLSYCSLFGHDKIDAIAFNSTAIFGESYTGDLLSGDMVLSNDSIMSFLDFIGDGTSSEQILSKIFDILENAGLGELVAELGNTILENLSDILLPEVVVPLFGRWLTIWAMVPDDQIDTAMDYTFSNYMLGNSEEIAELRDSIEEYNNLVRKNKTETLLDIDKDCKVGVIARHGYSSIPATSSWQEISDGVIDTANASFGARVSYYNATLDSKIIDNTPAEYISPDKKIDASTCLFPEKTWFIKGAKHSNSYDDLDKLINAILFAENEIDVYTFEEFPRFMAYDYETDSFIKDSAESESSSSGLISFIAKIKSFFADIMRKLRLLFAIQY